MDNRLELAGVWLAKTSFNENMKTAQHRLLNFGLVALANDSPVPTVARTIIQLLHSRERPSFDIVKGMKIDVVRSDALYVLAAIHFNVDVFVFSTHKNPRVFRSTGGVTHAVGIFEAIDTYDKSQTSWFLVLAGHRSKKPFSSQNRKIVLHTSLNSPWPSSATNLAKRHGPPSVTQRTKKRSSIQELNERVRDVIKDLRQKRTYQHPKPPATRVDLQASAYSYLKSKLKKTGRMPRGLMDKALNIVSKGKPIANTHSRKMYLFPNGCLEVWRDIVLSLFHWCWDRNWDRNWDDEEVVVVNPDPDHTPQEDYSYYITVLEEIMADAAGDQDPMDEESFESTTDNRVCSLPYKKLIRPDLSDDQAKKVLRMLEKAQADVSRVMEEVYNLAFCAMLAVAAGWTEPKDANDPMPSLDIRFILPSSYQLSEGVDTIAATSTQIHWDGDIYDKSFKYLVLALLRIWLAPRRFARTEEKRRDSTAAMSIRSTVRTSAMSKSMWMRQVRDLFNELAALTRKGSLDDKAAPRIEAILQRLRRLQKTQPAKGEVNTHPIPCIDEQLRQALYIAQLNVDDSTDQQSNEQEANEGLSDSESEEEDGELYPDEDDDYDNQAMAMLAEQENEGESDADSDGEDGDYDDDVVEKDEPESSGAQIKRVVSTLVHFPSIQHTVNTNHVSKALHKTTTCTVKELQAVRDIVNLLRPYAPKRVPTEHGLRGHTPFSALRAPMVLLAQAVLQVLHLHRFTRHLSLGHLRGSDCFDIKSESGNTITTVPDASRDQNKASVLGAFFNITLMRQHCRHFRIEFAHRLTFVDKYQVQLLSTVVPHSVSRKGYPVKSDFERRRAKKHALEHWQLDKRQLEELTTSSADIIKHKAEVYKKSPDFDPVEVFRRKGGPAKSRKEAYYWTRLDKVATSKKQHPNQTINAPTKLVPDWKNHQYEEEPTLIDVSQLLKAVRQDPKKTIGCAGGGPGIKTTLGWSHRPGTRLCDEQQAKLAEDEPPHEDELNNLHDEKQ
ncbi:hypothetical protein BGX28_003918 [Mortierella sp. GBA30]|nr:hypothetical protein BGX28_003918 [Mortierella sp. GBA30]